MKEGNTSMKLWVIITLISTFVGGAGLVAAGFTIFRALSVISEIVNQRLKAFYIN